VFAQHVQGSLDCQYQKGKTKKPKPKQNKKTARGVAQEVEQLHSKHKA
jgi:hypothetical protein